MFRESATELYTGSAESNPRPIFIIINFIMALIFMTKSSRECPPMPLLRNFISLLKKDERDKDMLPVAIKDQETSLAEI